MGRGHTCIGADAVKSYKNEPSFSDGILSLCGPAFFCRLFEGFPNRRLDADVLSVTSRFELQRSGDLIKTYGRHGTRSFQGNRVGGEGEDVERKFKRRFRRNDLATRDFVPAVIGVSNFQAVVITSVRIGDVRIARRDVRPDRRRLR